MKNIDDKNIELTKKDFSFVCPMKTKDMTAIESGYFCGECEKKVHDVSQMSESEYTKLVKKTDDICVTFKKVATVSLALSLAACSSPEESKPRLMGKVAAPSGNCTVDPSKEPKSLDSDKKIDTNKTIDVEYEVELGGDPVPIGTYKIKQ